MDNKFITIGKIVASHGVHGFAKVAPITDFPERFFDTERVFLFSGDKNITETDIEEIRTSHKFFIIKLAFFNTPEEVNKYKNVELKVPFEERLEIEEEDVFYIDDLIGLQVYSSDGAHLGKVNDVFSEPNTLIEVLTLDNKEVMVPFVKAIVAEVDQKNQKIIVNKLAGLFDNNFEVDSKI